LEDDTMKRDEVKQLIEQGVQELNDALAAGKSDTLTRFMEVMAKFPRYSFGNCILIAMQFPDAKFVQGFHGWKKVGRFVRKGEKGIGIIAPMVYRNKEAVDEDDRTLRGFKVVHVYDVSQTEGKELPEFARVSGDPGEHIASLEQVIRSHDIELVYEKIGSGADGLSQKGRVVIQHDLEPAERFATLVHELAHELLHADTERRKSTTKCIRETEAEAVAHVVCRAVGIDSTSHCADYIQLYSGDVNVLTASLDAVQKTAAHILEAMTHSSAQHEEVAA
jgi:antirestriction protein ArdC